MPLTLSGRRVAPDTTDHPNLIDIAVGLSRMPRFAGQTTRWFSVLDHTMFGLYLIEASTELPWQCDKRWWLLHDAHESMTGDVPTDLKTPDLRTIQANLDAYIFGAFYPCHEGTETGEARIKDLDRRCLRAEARVLKNGASIGGPPLTDDVEILQKKLHPAGPLAPNVLPWPEMYPLGIPPLMDRQEDHPLVRQYVSKMVELM